MSNNSNESLYDKVMTQMMSLNVDYKNIQDMAGFKLTIKNIIGSLFRGPYSVSRANDYVYIGQAQKESRQFQSDGVIPHGIGMQIKFDRSYRIGNWTHGSIYGYINIKYPDGSIYKGNYGETSRSPDGYGIGGQPGKSIYDGYWKNGKKHGEGLYIRFVDNSSKINFVAKGYFDMGKPVGIHLQTIMSENETYICNNDNNTKSVIPIFIPPNAFKKTSLLKYQPVPPRLSGGTASRAEFNAQDAKDALRRDTRAKEALMSPDELRVSRINAKKVAIEELRARTKATREKNKPKNKAAAAAAAAAAVAVAEQKEEVVYEVNPEDVSDEDLTDDSDVEDLTDDENERIKRKKNKNKNTKVDRDIQVCIICCENQIDCVILECGHLAICYSCGNDPSFKIKCPICRRPIQRLKQVFWAH